MIGSAKTWLLVLGLLLMPMAALAHAPEQHGFKITTFRKPPPAPEFSLVSPTGEPMTLKQIGVEIQLTRERVRQIECEALRKIKDHLVD